ncbi:MAG: murein L,D-transpeptidase [Gammaproteobacteria bacterium]
MPRPLARLRAACTALLLLLAVVAATGAPMDADPVAARIDARLAGDGDGFEAGGARLRARAFFRQVYAGAQFRPLWDLDDEARVFLELADRAGEEGLASADYNLQAIRAAIARAGTDPAARVDADLLLTDALARFAYHLRFGKANPEELDPDWNYRRDFDGMDPAHWLRVAIDAPDLGAALDELRPRTPAYAALRAALARYRTLARAPAWTAPGGGPTLEPGMRDARVAVLRARLAAENAIAPAAAGGPDLYDEPLRLAVVAFQGRHGLEPDGAVGPRTRAALAVSAQARVDQLRVNLDRLRWLGSAFGTDHVAVNVPAYSVALVRKGEAAWQARAIVGKRFRETPVFTAPMTYVVLNPSWTVPPTVLAEDILPAMRRDTRTLAKKALHVIDREGRPVDPATIDWKHADAGRFPWRLRQDPGPDNALGRIKFMLPNPHAVYLHDTPARALFERAERGFSSGCIRIERPLELAERLLDDPVQWNAAALQAAVDGGAKRRVDLPRPLPVMILYLTAFPGADGSVQFRDDIYGRDPAVRAALDGPFRFSAPRGFPR